ncbi:MAG: hypothetical protein IJD16_00820 [Desulfovibrio sp.]|nr:hypothetical protein [Desulfovibrio sp.]
MRVLLGCVNSAVSLVGYDLEQRQPFWYCPGNLLRVCGICWHEQALWSASDTVLQRVDAAGISRTGLPGPHDNYAHSVKSLGDGLLGVADTGNSRVLLMGGGMKALSLSPLEGWGNDLPFDAIHLNDFVLWQDGLLISAFNHQPFSFWKKSDLNWKAEGWGCLYYLRRHGGRSLTRIVASGLDCPHSLALWQGDVYCCSSACGTFFHYRQDEHGLLQELNRWKVTDTHFLRGCLRLEGGWLLGGSSQRHMEDGGGMTLFWLDDAGSVTPLPVGGPGEIYDIIPWDDALMPGICRTLQHAPELDVEGTFPARCSLPAEYGG